MYNDTINNDITSFKYIYLIEKFDVNNKEYIYKFGKTNREYSKRLKEHGDEAKLLLILDVDNCSKKMYKMYKFATLQTFSFLLFYKFINLKI